MKNVLMLICRFPLQCTVSPTCSQREKLLQVVIGDLLNIEDVLRAAQGVEYMFFTFAVQEGLLEASTIAAIAARDAGKRHSAHQALSTLSDVHIVRGHPIQVAKFISWWP